jgi:hypothetical protein
MPIQPDPIITIFRPPSAMPARRVRLSSTVLKVLTPSRSLPGSEMLRGRAPVASSREAYSSRLPSARPTVRVDGSSRVAGTPSRTSTPLSEYQASGATGRASSPALPSRYSLDSGGRRYGWCRSPASSTTGPLKPSARSVFAAVPSARPPPTITMLSTVILLDPRSTVLLKLIILTLEVRRRPVSAFGEESAWR